MGKGKGGGSGGGGGGGGAGQGGGAPQLVHQPKVAMTLKVVLGVKPVEIKEERRVAKSDGLPTFNPFPGNYPTPTFFRKR
ncbi:gamma-aminobutyric acid receptor subunit beta-like isoform X1 [Anopheles bellator]|uniref:gamma-aminobutyric acid receptor subunit beta-like isoform X1 n=1 Tax=Anopheles bellator TaxID=139047 RepID=UPI0026480091|nr:gamma-aminobutyric acid receptor subunit beta-like isoform X1 [Anopheles bellator]